MTRDPKQEALDYHKRDPKGKIEVVPTKPYSSQADLSMAYSPGVAEPSREIGENRKDVYQYTAKGNLVAVISDGSAVLGLGNIGPEASKPVMEGKGVLFKIYADIDVFDLELDSKDPEHFISTVKALGPTFGGINLEDIKAPECFEIEKRLKEELDIPVMHDDQHGTAIITGAAMMNATHLAGKRVADLRIVISGAGASAMACARLYTSLGVRPENIVMTDSKGVIRKDREELGPLKAPFATERDLNTLEEAMEGADLFLGLSMGNIVSRSMIRRMARDPIVFALANPDPEIPFTEAKAARDDVIMATGRSDDPNQVNNVLGFPFIFRGALDVHATHITEGMKHAAVEAIAKLAREPVPEEVIQAYGVRNLSFGPDYLIPKPMDPRLLSYVSPAVAKAAIEAGVARIPIRDWDQYRVDLDKRLGMDNKLIQQITEKVRGQQKRIVFAEAEHPKILKAAHEAAEEGIAAPVLLGPPERIRELIDEYELELKNVEILDPRSATEEQRREQYGDLFFRERQRKGYTLYESLRLMHDRNYFGAMMVRNGEADALISGITRKYPDVLRPALQSIGRKKETKRVAAMHIMFSKKGPLFFADTTVNQEPSAEDLAEIAMLSAKKVEDLKITPRVAMLSYSNFGSARGSCAEKVQKAVKILHQEHPELIVDGDIQMNFALNNELMREKFPFSELLDQEANIFIFPNLAAGNIAYKLMQEMTRVETIGPVLMGMKEPFHVLQLGSSVREILNMVKIAATDARESKEPSSQ